ncbi:hypothetical protein GH733_010881, partial [Mirounga leonina]
MALIKPDAISKAGEIIEMINKAGFTITKLKMMMLSSELIQFITSGPTIAMEILRDDAICEWKRLLGPANSGMARTDAPGSLRALFGTDGIRNAAHGPNSFASAARVRKWSYFFLQVEFVDQQTLLSLQIVPVALLSPMPSV